MLINAIFTTLGGTPATGLSPTIIIINLGTGATIVNGAAMTEVSNGSYKYDFTIYDSNIDYHIICNGNDPTLDGNGYAFGSNEANSIEINTENIENKIDIINTNIDDMGTLINTISTNVTTILKVETGRWKIVDNQMIFYDDNGTTPLFTFDLLDSSGNPTESNPAERDPI